MGDRLLGPIPTSPRGLLHLSGIGVEKRQLEWPPEDPVSFVEGFSGLCQPPIFSRTGKAIF